MECSAVLSDDGMYRYMLERDWSGKARSKYIAFVMLNPSTADHEIDDPTITRCIWFAEREGFDRLVVVNLFAFRATDPKQLRQAKDPIGPDNDSYIRRLKNQNRCGRIVCAWGAHPMAVERGMEVKQILNRRLFCLGTNKSGSPKHPLYLRHQQPMIDFTGSRVLT